MKNPMRHLGESLRLVSSCPLCGAKYTQECASIIEENKSAFLIHVQCQKCQSSVVSTMTRGQVGVSSVGLITDLTSDDVAKFHREQPLDSEDVLDLHDFLQDNSVALQQELSQAD
jgi:transcription elongation factor Elf1